MLRYLAVVPLATALVLRKANSKHDVVSDASPCHVTGMTLKYRTTSGVVDASDSTMSQLRLEAAYRVLSSPIAPGLVGASLCETLDQRFDLSDALDAVSSEVRAKYDVQPPARDVHSLIHDLRQILQKAENGTHTRGIVSSILGIVRATDRFAWCDYGLNQKLANVQGKFGEIFRYWMAGITTSPSDLEEMKKMDAERTEAMKLMLYLKRNQANAYLKNVFCPAVYQVALVLTGQFDQPMGLQCSRMPNHLARLQALLAPLTQPYGKCWDYYLCGRADCKNSTDPKINAFTSGSETVEYDGDLYPKRQYPVVLGSEVATKALLDKGLYYHPQSKHRRATDYEWELKRDTIADRSVLTEMLDLVDDVQIMAAKSVDKAALSEDEENTIFSILAFSQGFTSFRSRHIVDQDYWNGAYLEKGACRIAADFTALANVRVLKPYKWSPVNRTIGNIKQYNTTLQWASKILNTPTATSAIYQQRNELNTGNVAANARKVSVEGLDLILSNATEKVRLALEKASANELGQMSTSILGISHSLHQTHNLCNGDLLLQAWSRIKKGSKRAWTKFKKFFQPRSSDKYSYLQQKVTEQEKRKLQNKLTQQLIFEKTLQADRYGNEVLCPALFDTLKKELQKPKIDANKTRNIVILLRDELPSMASPAACMYFYWCGNSTCDRDGSGLKSYNAWTRFENAMGDLLYNTAEDLQKSTDEKMHHHYDPNEEKVPLVTRWEKRARKWKFHYKNTTDWLNPDHFIVKEGCDPEESKKRLRFECFQPIVLGDKEMTLKLIKHDAYLDPRMFSFSDDSKRFYAQKKTLHRWHAISSDFMIPLNILTTAHILTFMHGPLEWGAPFAVLGALHFAEAVSAKHHKMQDLFGDKGVCSIVSSRMLDFLSGEHHAMDNITPTQLRLFADNANIADDD